MAIRIIEKGEVNCDSCKKEIAKIKASRQIFDVLREDGERFCSIICNQCQNNPPRE